MIKTLETNDQQKILIVANKEKYIMYRDINIKSMADFMLETTQARKQKNKLLIQLKPTNKQKQIK